MEIDTDPMEGSSYDLGVTVKAEIKEEDEDDHYNTIVRGTTRQIDLLVDYMSTHTQFANGHCQFRGPLGQKCKEKQWVQLQQMLQEYGPSKTVEQWRTTWRDLKKKARADGARVYSARAETGNHTPIPHISNNSTKILSILGMESASGMEGHQEAELEEIVPPPQTTLSPPATLRSSPPATLRSSPPDIKPSICTNPEPPVSTLMPPSTPSTQQASDEASERHQRARSLKNKCRVSDAETRSVLLDIKNSLRESNKLTERKLRRSHLQRALLELAQCVQSNQEPIEFNSTDAMMDPKTGLMICLHCLEDFDTSLLSDHMINTHNYRRVLFKCHVCQNTFQERKLLMIHRQECQPEQKVRKRKTFQQIMREVEAKYFMEEQEDLLEPVSCPICLLELPKYCLKEHLLNEHRKPDVILTCGRCNRNFKSKLTLREHVKLVHEAIEDSEECEQCGQKFRSLKYLSNHKRNVHPSGNKIHKCAVCGKEFKSRLCLHQHSKYVHPPESASVECPHCPNKVFKSRMNLTQHLKVSHGWKRK